MRDLSIWQGKKPKKTKGKLIEASFSYEYMVITQSTNGMAYSMEYPIFQNLTGWEHITQQ